MLDDICPLTRHASEIMLHLPQNTSHAVYAKEYGEDYAMESRVRHMNLNSASQKRQLLFAPLVLQPEFGTRAGVQMRKMDLGGNVL